MFTHEIVNELQKSLEHCHDICLETIRYCLLKNIKKAEASYILVLADCARACEKSEDYIGSELEKEFCKECAIRCEICADECEKMGNDTQISECAEVCRNCTELCREAVARVNWL